MAYSMSSVSVEESLEKVVAFTGEDEHLRRFVTALEGGQPVGEVKEWSRLGGRHRHRIEWKAGGLRGWLKANRQGHVTSITAEVHTNEPDPGMDARLDAALLQLKAAIESVDEDDIRTAEASPSLVVETVLKALIRSIPSEQRAPMRPYLERASQLDGSEPRERGRVELCVKWAEKLAEEHKAGLARLAAELEEEVKLLEDKVEGALAEAEQPVTKAVVGVGEVPPGVTTELDEIYDALEEARKVAAHEGWDSVPWPALLDDLSNA